MRVFDSMLICPCCVDAPTDCAHFARAPPFGKPRSTGTPAAVVTVEVSAFGFCVPVGLQAEVSADVAGGQMTKFS